MTRKSKKGLGLLVLIILGAIFIGSQQFAVVGGERIDILYEPVMGSYCCEATGASKANELPFHDGGYIKGVYKGADAGKLKLSFFDINFGCSWSTPFYDVWVGELPEVRENNGVFYPPSTLPDYALIYTDQQGFEISLSDGDNFVVQARCDGFTEDWNAGDASGKLRQTYFPITIFNYVGGAKLTLTETGFSCTDQEHVIVEDPVQPKTERDLQRVTDASNQEVGNVVYGVDVAELTLGTCAPYIARWETVDDPLMLSTIREHKGVAAVCRDKRVRALHKISTTSNINYWVPGDVIDNVECCHSADCELIKEGSFCSDEFKCEEHITGKICIATEDCGPDKNFESGGQFLLTTTNCVYTGEGSGICSYDTVTAQCTPEFCAAKGLFCEPLEGCRTYVARLPEAGVGIGTTLIGVADLDEDEGGLPWFWIIIIGVIAVIGFYIFRSKGKRRKI